MAIDVSYGKLIDRISAFKVDKRTESAAFLIWFLVNYYRMDELDAIDCICDQSNDKGVDGIYVNEDAETIDIFQSKLSQKDNSSVGDTLLKEFTGTLSQFESAEAVAKLADSAKGTRLASLIKWLDLEKKISEYRVRGVLVVNLDLDSNGMQFMKHKPPIRFFGKAELEHTYVSDEKESIQTGKAKFDIFGLSVTDYQVDNKTTAVVAAVSATDLVKLKGIEDQSLFASNVRASLGSTKVNRDIGFSIRDPGLHKSFLLFHNGITVLAKTVKHDDKQIEVEDYYVVNGCQSLNTLYTNRKHITGDLRILTKFIQVEAGSKLADTITNFSNTQNGIKPRDFKSNHPIQTRLQREFETQYGGEYALEIKRGAPIGKKAEVISNEDAGLLLIAFDLKEPWTTHRKYQVFDDRYAEIFGRPVVTADRLVFVQQIADAVTPALLNLKNELFGRYVLTKFVMLTVMRRVLEEDEVGRKMLDRPQDYVRDPATRARFRAMMDGFAASMVIDLDVETQELDADFDYRGKLRDREYVSDLVNKLVATYRKDVLRKKAPTVADAWAATA